MRSPKQLGKKTSLYQYYAGFSGEFVIDIVEKYASPGMRILDPWNGSGTTTSICSNMEYKSVGMDVNPATLPIAWARLCGFKQISEICTKVITTNNQAFFDNVFEDSSDNLIELFFDKDSCSVLRGLRSWIVTAAKEIACESESQIEYAISGVGFVIFSEVIREAMKPLRGTNPSWFRRPNHDNLIKIDRSQASSSIKKIAAEMLGKVGEKNHSKDLAVWPDLILGDVRSDVEKLGKFDLVITSPPYCTRIDYAIATIPELIALGNVSSHDFEALRSEITGAVLTSAKEDLSRWDNQFGVAEIMQKIIQHPSKASSTYYARYFSRYFNDLKISIEQLVRYTGAGHFAMVVQSSYFKDVKIDLGKIVSEMFEANGCSSISSASYPSRPTIAGSNPHAKSYRDFNVQTEDVLIFKGKG